MVCVSCFLIKGLGVQLDDEFLKKVGSISPRGPKQYYVTLLDQQRVVRIVAELGHVRMFP